MNTLPARFTAWAAAVLLAATAGIADAAVEFPGPDPGKAIAEVDPGRIVLENHVLRCEWSLAGGRLKPVRVTDKLSRTALPMDGGESFRFLVAKTPAAEPRRVRASEFRLAGMPRVTALAPAGSSRRLWEQCRGWRVEAGLEAPGFWVRWTAILCDGDNFVRQHVSISTHAARPEPAELQDLTLIEMAAPKAEEAGSVDGSPVVTGNFFFGCEHPMARNVAAGSGEQTVVRCGYPYPLPAGPGNEPAELTSVIGVAPEGQMRRAFLHYLERVRPQPYQTFLHYNCGYEIGARFWQVRRFGTPAEFEKLVAQQEQMWLDRIAVFGRELVEKRGVVLDSFVHDHAWDDTDLVWQFHKGFPQGLTNIRAAAEKFRSAAGIWFSPWGGYSGRARRVEAGQRQGFETSRMGLTLAGPRYYERFREACAGMVRDYGVNYFKFDGFGAGNDKDGAGPFASDVEALLRLHRELRALKPDVFLNPTTGTWPSPFWLLWADSIWRQQSDAGFLGKGSDRQQWLTYRDNATYHGTLERGPLYPIGNLMLHGIMIHKFAFKNPYDPKSRGVSCDPADLLAEIRSYFATGTCMQELHIDPTLMTDALWDTLAEAANWSRRNADVFADTHWVGGDPAKGEVYGWASWSPGKAALALRNPSDQPAKFALDVAKAFELPAGAIQTYTLKSPWKSDAAKPAMTVTVGQPHEIQLGPFEVAVWDASPSQ
jgi:hypothetical protein